jgi:hypothetical protein
MARSLLTDTKQDLIGDSGSVLWSFIKGEQLEFPIEIDFLDNILNGYELECVVVEALNTLKQEEPPTDIRPGGAQTTLNIRYPNYVGIWDENNLYDINNIVKYEDVHYRLSTGLSYSNTTPPDIDTVWVLAKMNEIFIRFPSTLGSDWGISPTVNHPVYGYFELRITEPQHLLYRKTWKPVRGLVQLLFSPTHIVPDV